MNDVTFIILGATGDLAQRKLFPALYRLLAKNKIEKFAIVAAALENDSVERIFEKAQKFIKNGNQNILARMHERMIYEPINFNKENDFLRVAHLIEKIEKKFGLSGNRLVYLATASEFFCPITMNLASSQIVVRKKDGEKPWNRIVYEKPFGQNAVSAQEINQCIQGSFEEHQIYRIDHFLTKEIVSNIALVRFANCVFEPLWNNRYIDQVQIILSEKLGIENRGAYYDKYGALSDVVQNHMLELLALIAMESPEKLTGNYIRSRRVEILKDIEVVDGILGQFERYNKEQHVSQSSKTETFAALLLRVNNPRWAGVPFYVKTGKCLKKKETIIHIKFKQVDCLLTHSCPVPSNWLSLEISPEATFVLTLNVKKPGRSENVVPVGMEFCHSCLFGPVTPEAYEVILEEVIHGEQSISVRFDEIEWAWRIIDTVRAMHLPLYSYQCGTSGPDEVETFFEKKHGMRWRS